MSTEASPESNPRSVPPRMRSSPPRSNPPPAFLPAFAREMGGREQRHKLWWGIWAGYAVALAYLGLVLAAYAAGMVPEISGLLVLVAIKLTTNTLSWGTLKLDRLVLEASGLNLAADVVVLTGAVWATGDVRSPLLVVYGIELLVIALITNVGVTVLTGVMTFVAFTSMVLLVDQGIVPRNVSPLDDYGSSPWHFPVVLTFVLFVLGLPTAFAAAMLSRLRARERELAQRNAELVEAQKQKAIFMATITHELRTPIHGITGLSDVVSAGVYGPVTEKQRAALRDVKSSARSLLQLIDDLITLTRQEAGRLEVVLDDDVVVADLITQVTEAARFMVGTRDLDVHAELEPGLPAIATDRRKLSHVLVNLIANAVKFTPDGGKVITRARRDGDTVVIEVADTGIGIAEADLSRVFEPFQQVDGTEERRYGGAGLGLTLVRQLTRVLGVEIEVESEEGLGSTFRLVVPTTKQTRARAA